MKKAVIFYSLLIAICALCNCKECFKSGTNSFEVYCENFTAVVPEDCVNTYRWENETHPFFTDYSNFKAGGCKLGNLLQHIAFYTIFSLDISHSKYTKLYPFKVESNELVKLNVSHNEIEGISTVDFGEIKNLSEIDFSYNKIYSIRKFDFDGADKLTTIHLCHNNIKDVHQESFLKLKNLTFIDLTNNSIVTIDKPFHNILTLKTVLLNANPLDEFTCDFLQLAKNGASVEFPWDNIGPTIGSNVSILFHLLQLQFH